MQANKSMIGMRCMTAAVLLVAASAALAAGEWMTPEYAKGEYRPLSMVIVPPRAEVMLKKVASTEQMVEESGLIEDATVRVLENLVEDRGYEIRTLRVDEVNADPELQAMIRALNEVYDDEMPRLRTKAKDIRERRYGFGDPARVLASRLGADALIMARVNALGASGGQKTMAVLFGGTMGHTDVSVGIVAGDNGDLEAFYQQVITNVSPEKLGKEPDETMQSVLKKVMKKFPAFGEQAKWSRKWPERTDREVPEALAEEGGLDELESLFEDEAAPAAEAADSAGTKGEEPAPAGETGD